MDFQEVTNMATEARLNFQKKKLQLDTDDKETPENTMENTTIRKVPRSTQWYQARAIKLDSEGEERCKPPVKRHTRIKEFYSCGKCGRPKNNETGHRQCKGRWCCPRVGISYNQWKASLPKKQEKNVHIAEKLIICPDESQAYIGFRLAAAE